MDSLPNRSCLLPYSTASIIYYIGMLQCLLKTCPSPNKTRQTPHFHYYYWYILHTYFSLFFFLLIFIIIIACPSFLSMHILFFCTCLYSCSIKVPCICSLRVHFLFLAVFSGFPLLFLRDFCFSHCDSLGYLWDCSMCPHAVRLLHLLLLSMEKLCKISCIVQLQQFLGSSPLSQHSLCIFHGNYEMAFQQKSTSWHGIYIIGSFIHLIVYCTDSGIYYVYTLPSDAIIKYILFFFKRVEYYT